MLPTLVAVPPPTSQSLSPADAGTLASRLDRKEAVQREEHAAAVARLRSTLRVGVVLWLLFFGLDYMVVTHLVPGALFEFACLRLLGSAINLVVIGRLSVEPLPSPRLLAVLDFIALTTAALFLSAMCLLLRGIESPYASSILLVMTVRTVALAGPWTQGLLHLGAQALTFPLLCGLGALFSPTIQAQFQDSGALAMFAFNNAVLVGGVALNTLSGHALWQLRRRASEERSIGRYRLLRCIGKGGMGEVWAAEHRGLRRQVALKLMTFDDPAALGRFEREVRATTELTHPNTIRIIDYGVTGDGLFFYAMELLSGCDLAQVVEREGPLPPARAIHLLRQVCGSLGEAHRRQIIHRDLKPENLFLTTQGGLQDFVKVLDFGLAKFLGPEPGAQGLTATGTMAGTPLYMSPEAVAGNRSDAASDVYALGGVLYFLLCGAPPFFADTPWEVFKMHMNELPVPPSRKLGRPLPADLEAVVLRCLNKQPTERYVDAAALDKALAACSDANTWPEHLKDADGLQ